MNFYNGGHSAYATTPHIQATPQTHHQQQNSPHIAHRALQAAVSSLEQPPAPSLREILGAYRLKGDGDREMLLAILNAKAAEDQRVAATANLQQTILNLSFASTSNAQPSQPPSPPTPPAAQPAVVYHVGHPRRHSRSTSGSSRSGENGNLHWRQENSPRSSATTTTTSTTATSNAAVAETQSKVMSISALTTPDMDVDPVESRGGIRTSSERSTSF